MEGGVANKTPISHAVELGAERTYVLPTGHACSLDEPPHGALAMPPPCPLNIQPIDFAHADELVDVALLDARDFLDGGGEAREPIRLRMHRHSSVPAGPVRTQPATEVKPPTIAP
jgi:NTE family protein